MDGGFPVSGFCMERDRNTAVAVWNGIRDFFSGLWAGIKTLFTTVVTAISTFLVGAWNGIRATVMAVWNAISAFLGSVWNGIKSVITNVVNGIRTFFAECMERDPHSHYYGDECDSDGDLYGLEWGSGQLFLPC